MSFAQGGVHEDRPQDFNLEDVVPDWGPMYDRTVLLDTLMRTNDREDFLDAMHAVYDQDAAPLEDKHRRKVELFLHEYDNLESSFEKLVPAYRRDPQYWSRDRSHLPPEVRLGVVWNDDFGKGRDDIKICESFTSTLSTLMDQLDVLTPVCQANRNFSCAQVNQTLLKMEFIWANAATAHCARLIKERDQALERSN